MVPSLSSLGGQFSSFPPQSPACSDPFYTQLEAHPERVKDQLRPQGKEVGGGEAGFQRQVGEGDPRPGQGRQPGHTHTPSMLSSSSWKALAASSCSRWALEAACCSVEGPLCHPPLCPPAPPTLKPALCQHCMPSPVLGGEALSQATVGGSRGQPWDFDLSEGWQRPQEGRVGAHALGLLCLGGPHEKRPKHPTWFTLQHEGGWGKWGLGSLGDI